MGVPRFWKWNYFSQKVHRFTHNFVSRLFKILMIRYVIFNIIVIHNRDAKGRKVSGKFGNFPWKVSGILKRWEFLEILGIFIIDLFSTFYDIVCTQININ